MKLEVRLLLRDDLEKKLLRNRHFSKEIDLAVLPYTWVNYDSEFVSRIIQESVGTSGMRVYLHFEITKKEFENVKYYEVEPRSIIRMDDHSLEKNEKYMEGQPYIITSDRTRIKLRERVYIGKPFPKTMTISSIEFGEGYVSSKEVSSIFIANKVTAYIEYPVFESTTDEAIDKYVLIGSGNILPPLTEDVTILPAPGSPEDDLYYRRLGLPSYPSEEMESFCDFNITAESYRENDTGLMVVSEKVIRLVKDNKIRGVAFRPVLDRSTKLYDKYLKIFSSFQESLMVNPNNVIS